MNYEQANEVKHLAAPVNKVLEGLEVECPVCKGIDIRNKVIESCSCGNTGKIKWKWQPKWGDYFINKFDDSICIFLTDRNGFMDYLLPNGNSQLMHKADFKYYVLTILGWEEIRNILRRAGYHINVTSGVSGGQITIYPIIGTEKIYEKIYYSGDLQTAVMKAVLDWVRK